MKKLVSSLLFFAVVFFLFPIFKTHAAYQSATGVLKDFPGVIYPQNDGSNFMNPPFPRSTGYVGKNRLDGSTFVTLYTTTAPTACSLVKKVKGSITLKSTHNNPSEIGIFFGAMNIK